MIVHGSRGGVLYAMLYTSVFDREPELISVAVVAVPVVGAVVWFALEGHGQVAWRWDMLWAVPFAALFLLVFAGWITDLLDERAERRWSDLYGD